MWNVSRDQIKALSSVNTEMYKYMKFKHKMHMNGLKGVYT